MKKGRSPAPIPFQPDSTILASDRNTPIFTTSAECNIPPSRTPSLLAFQLLSRLEGIIPALESAHAVAELIRMGPGLEKGSVVVVNLSGRGDKDVAQAAELLEGQPALRETEGSRQKAVGRRQ